MMKFKIIGTGSQGNAFLFEDNLLIDCGLSFKKLSEAIDISKIEYVLLSHIHGDHFNKIAIRKLFVANDNVQFICGEWLVKYLNDVGVTIDRITVVEYGAIYDAGDFKIAPVKAYHDVPNMGYRLILNGHKHFHITDTSTLKGITATNYKSATIECNHCVVKANEIIEQAKEDGEFTHLPGAMNSHLSVQETVAFVNTNDIAELTPIHIGESTRREVELYVQQELA